MSTIHSPSRPPKSGLARTCMALAGALLLAFGTIVTDAVAETRTVRVNCPEETSKDIKLKGIETGVIFEVYGCACSTDPEVVKRNVAEGSSVRGDQATYGGIGKEDLKPGEVFETTLYCLSNDQINAFREGTTSQ